MKCPNCFAMIESGTIICPDCGFDLRQINQQSSSPGPESVSPYASFGTRLAAFALDYFIVIAVLVPFAIPIALISYVGHLSEETDLIISYTIGVIVPWLYWAAFESSKRQATLGKRVVGILVTDVNGNRLTFLRATARHFSKIVSASTLLAGFVMAAFTQRRQALHDLISGCLVLKKQ